MAVTLRQLRYLVALAEAGGFGAAAARVHVSQPALSAQLRELEATLGARLVDRLPRGIRLTRAGEAALERARRALAEVAELERAARRAGGLAGRLSLGVIPTVAPYLLPHALTRLRARDLALDIRVREAMTDDLVLGLERGALDAAVLALPVPPGLRASPIATDRFLLAGSRARLDAWAARTEALRPSAVPGDQLLLLDEGHCLSGQALEVCGLSGRRPADLGASSLSTLCGLVAEGFGLTLLPEIALATESRPGLATLRFAAPEPARTLALAVRSGNADPWIAELAGLLAEAATAAGAGWNRAPEGVSPSQ